MVVDYYFDEVNLNDWYKWIDLLLFRGVVLVLIILGTFSVQADVFNIPNGDVTALINAINSANSNGRLM